MSHRATPKNIGTLRIEKQQVDFREKETRGPSVTFTNFYPDPFVFVATDGTRVYQLDTGRLNLLDLGATTQISVSWNATSLGWNARHFDGDNPPDILVEIKDSSGGVLEAWDIGTPDVFRCGGPAPVVFQNPNGLQGLIPLTSTVTIYFGGTTYYHC